MKEINEKMMKEIEIGAGHMGIATNEAVAKYTVLYVKRTTPM